MHDERYLIQRAVTNELSVLGESICVKYFVAVTSFAPLRVYIHSEALVSFGSHWSASGDQSGLCSSARLKWPIGQLKTHLLKSFTIEQLHFMEKQVHDMVIKTLISAADIIGLATRSNMPSPDICFELFGFDVIMDDKLSLWLAGVDSEAIQSCSDPTELRIKARDAFSAGLESALVRLKALYEQRSGIEIDQSDICYELVSLDELLKRAEVAGVLDQDDAQLAAAGLSDDASKSPAPGSLVGRLEHFAREYRRRTMRLDACPKENDEYVATTDDVNFGMSKRRKDCNLGTPLMSQATRVRLASQTVAARPSRLSQLVGVPPKYVRLVPFG
ncbi:Tubulin polyglutamylase ttll5 [Polyrhizophydium stewartii]|uniref:Tubulin--tyrosine ligase-like protein 5 n=1 Tax=Polyrhizophydium stewartii TaxID=2732419 RepID=A0ABR4NKQ3_9FUNG